MNFEYLAALAEVVSIVATVGGLMAGIVARSMTRVS